MKVGHLATQVKIPQSRGEIMTTRNFEDALKKLENIVHKIEEGQMSLEETLKAFEEGVKLARFCQSKLDEAQKKVEILMKDEKGNLRSRPFQEE